MFSHYFTNPDEIAVKSRSGVVVVTDIEASYAGDRLARAVRRKFPTLAVIRSTG